MTGDGDDGGELPHVDHILIQQGGRDKKKSSRSKMASEASLTASTVSQPTAVTRCKG